MTDKEVAEVCYEANRAYCEAIGDDPFVPWRDAPEWQKESNINGVEMHRENDVGVEASHEAWRAEKVADGWVYGERKDPELKTHPCMLPYYELPVAQQAKDHIFKAIVIALT